MISLTVIVMLYSLRSVLPTHNIRAYQHLPLNIMIGPIIDKNMCSLSTGKLSNDNSWDNKDFDVFLMSVSGLKPFIILRETADENKDTNDDQENMYKTEELKPDIDLNKIQYFSKSYHIGRIHLEQINTLRLLNRTKQK
ncbi:Uncharacterized protein FWK35_00002694 [Aphis craccivora]|uniref:Uncharacterized protein n=1 Tax=Aphis craccivora TaxID=307492 RepID=A0A6G0ZFT3_APHCR|nr:Uncharacterized protein FWK35_00002694 [Aphis craccivora]